MLKIFKKPVATILEAINVMRWRVDLIDINVRKLREMPETQTFTMVKLHGPIFNEQVPATKIEAATKQAMAEELGVQLLKAGAIKFEITPTELKAVYGPGRCQCTEYRATIRVIVPKPAEVQEAANE